MNIASITATLRSYLDCPISETEYERVTGALEWLNLPGAAQDHRHRNILRYGPMLVLDAPKGRGTSFGANQGIGAWGESLLENAINVPGTGYCLVRFGPSNGIESGEDGYRFARLKYREIEVLEGKRPDFLILPDKDADLARAIGNEWSERPLTRPERDLVRERALAGIEVKLSEIHHGSYRRDSGRSLSVTVKCEEMPGIRRWSALSGLPVLIVQGMLDELWALSLSEFERRKGQPRQDPVTRKETYSMRLEPDDRLIARIVGGHEYQSIRLTGRGKFRRPLSWPAASLRGFDASYMMEALSDRSGCAGAQKPVLANAA